MVITSPVIRSACRAVTRAMVPLVNSARCLTPKYSHRAFSNCLWKGPLFVRILSFHICSRYGINSSSGGKCG